MSVEIEGDGWLSQALAWMEIARPGEVEEALDTLGSSGGNEKSVEVYVFSPASRPSTSSHLPKRRVVLIIQVFLYINRQT